MVMKYLVPIFLIVLILMPAITYGQNGEELERILSRIENILFQVGLGIAVIVFIISGIMYLTSGGDEAKLSKAKKILLYGIIGAAIIFASTFIVLLVENIIFGQ
jgi:type IV secretory pathway VirB2 component (pilin)